MNAAGITTLDPYIHSVVMNREDYESLLRQDKRFDVYRHFSPMRESLLGFVSFDKEASLLEIGAEFGAMTGLFLRSVRTVTALVTSALRAEALQRRYQSAPHLRVIQGDLTHLDTREKFDYIVFAGGFEWCAGGYQGKNPYVSTLSFILAHLKPEGRLFFTSENRFGLKYFSGAPDRLTGLPFSGLNGYPGGFPGYTFSRRELIAILNDIPNLRYRFYYPIPDWQLPQMIYSDSYVPKTPIRELSFYQREDTRSLFFNERDLYDELVDNQVLPFLANSFLIECGYSGQFQPIHAAFVTGDRGPAHHFATLLKTDQTAVKRALRPEAIPSLASLHQHLSALEAAGVPVVGHRLADGELRMPFKDLPTLSQQLKTSVRLSNKQEVFRLFDLLYRDVIRSSVAASPAKNRLLGKGIDPTAFGPVLERAYVDMIPSRCFYAGDHLIYFSQETTAPFIPANYVMYRAIQYSYAFARFLSEVVSIGQMRKRYGISDDMVPLYQAVHERFLAERREQALHPRLLENASFGAKDAMAHAKAWYQASKTLP